MDRDLGRLKRMCGGLYYVLLIVSVAMIIVAVMMVAALGLLIADPSLAADFELEVDITSGSAATAVALVAVLVLFCLVVVFELMSIAKSIYREYTPFTKKNVTRLETLALVCLLLPVLLSPLMYVLTGDLTVSDVVITCLGSMITAAVFYCLALVFRYGCWLQKESDETL